MSIARTRQSRVQYAVKPDVTTLPTNPGDSTTVEFSGVPARGLIHRVAIIASSQAAVNNQPRFYDSVYLHYLGRAGENERSAGFAETMFCQLAYDQQNRNTLSGYSVSDAASGTSARFISIVDCVPVNCGGVGSGGFYNAPHPLDGTLLSFDGTSDGNTPVIEGASIRTTSGVFPPGGIFYDTQSSLIAGVTSPADGPNFTDGNKLYLTLMSEGLNYETTFPNGVTFLIDIEPTH
mgnify:CR=1 FL=1|tara:strand:+ start:3772 stop:4476 length:705 start_codon:yes stop_codon:yes gene_type:complete